MRFEALRVENENISFQNRARILDVKLIGKACTIFEKMRMTKNAVKGDGMKSVLITGASGGMGRAAAEHYVEGGYTVFALDVRACEVGGVIPIVADVTSEESLAAAHAEVEKYTQRLDAIVHFAGIYMLDSLLEMDSTAFDRIFSVNLRGVFLVNKLFCDFLGVGSKILITTSELAPLDPLPFTGIYAVTKGALDKYAYSLRMEMQLLGIDVSVLRAGAVDTGMLGVSTEALEKFCEKTKIYKCNSKRFKSVVDRVEARCVSPRKIAEKSLAIIKKRKSKFAYCINRNPLLLMLNALPKRMQLWIIRVILR